MNESEMQQSVMAEVDLKASYDERYRYIFHVPNGGKRNVIVATKLKREGVRAGVPDLICLLARHGYHGLVMELKVGDNDTSAAQDKWLKWLANAGYCACIVRNDPAEAMRILEWYLGANE